MFTLKNKKYTRKKKAAAKRSRNESTDARDIAPIPAVVDPKRRATAEASFEFFCRTYLSEAFYLPWSNDHRKAIERIEQAVREGGLFAYAMPRGSGKTMLARSAALWATLCGYRQFVLLIGSDETAANESLEAVQTQLETNKLLAADFPEVCYPIQRLEGIAHRCKGQTLNGKRTYIGWMAKEIVYPTVPGSSASGAVIKVAGLTGRIRGMNVQRPDGKSVRPDLVIPDDPQTDESARSPSQCATRERLLAGAVLGLAGPGKKISGIMPCTVIAPDDLADRLLDRKRNPIWQGERSKMLESFPSNNELWGQYQEIRDRSLRAGNGGREATEFYRANREAMEAGAVASWSARFNADEISAVQHAMNLKLNDEVAFFAEYQNEPKLINKREDDLTATAVLQRVVTTPRLQIPPTATHLSAMIDVQGKILPYMVAAFEPNFTGHVVEYGSYPDQKTAYYTREAAKRSYQQIHKGGAEASLYAAIQALIAQIATREYKTATGQVYRVGRILVDSGWGSTADTVYKACRESPHANIVAPSKGHFIGASSTPFEQYTRKAGETLGDHWWIPVVKNRRAIRHVLIDTNHWKTFFKARVLTSIGDSGALTIHAGNDQAHQMLADHLCAEFSIKKLGKGREVEEWQAFPTRPNNDFLDCIVGCMVGASMQGVQLNTAARPTAPAASHKPKQRKRVFYAENF